MFQYYRCATRRIGSIAARGWEGRIWSIAAERLGWLAQSAQLAPIILRLSFCGQLRYRRHQIQRAARESIRARNRSAIWAEPLWL